MARKAIRITGIAVVGFLLILILLPFVFKGKIVERVKREINEQLDAKVEFGPFGLSLIRQFPQLTLWVQDVRVIGKGAFEGDTLADVGRLMVSLDLMKALLRGEYEIGRLRLDHPTIKLKLLADGRANWNIMVLAADEPEEDDEAVQDVVLGLKRVEIRGGQLAYLDDKFLTTIYADDINGVLRGDLSMSRTRLSTRDATIGSFSLRYDRWPLLNRVLVNLTAEMDADLERFVFTFLDNRIRINELPLVFEGMVGWPVEDLEMDFRFASARSDFASFLSIVPAMYTTDFKDLTSSGTLKLEGHVKGAYTATDYPGFGLLIEVNDGMFRYPGLPASVGKVQFRARVDNPGKDLDLTVVDVPVLSMELAGAPVDGRFHLRRPVSDPDFDIGIRGLINLSDVERFYPLEEGYALQGHIDADLEMKGSLSAFERADYEAFHAAGKLLATEIVVVAPSLEHAIAIDGADLRFTPREVSLAAFDMRLGQSDLSAAGSIHNLPGFLFGQQLLRGSFTTRSSFFDLNTLMDQLPDDKRAGAAGTEQDAAEPAADRGPDEQSPVSVIRIPANIDITLQSSFDQVLFGRLQIAGVEGLIHIAEEQVNMERLHLNLLGGILELKGIYDSRDQRPWVNLGLNILGFDIDQTFQTFFTARLLAPIGEYARGNFSASLQLSSLLDEGLRPVLASLKGRGNLRSSSVVLENTPSMSMLAEKLQMDQFREFSLKDQVLSFIFSDGKVELPPFDMHLGEIHAKVAGVTYFDRRISYMMKMELPRSMFGGRANQVLEDLVSRAAGLGMRVTPGEMIPVDVSIGGYFRRPEVSVSLATVRDNIEQQLQSEISRMVQEAETRLRDEAEAARDRLEAEVQERADDSRERAREELEARAGQVMAEAHSQAEVLRAQAAALAEQVRREGREQAARLEREASGQGPLAQAAARQAAQQLIREADRRATQIEAEAERNIEKVLEEARQQADRVRRGEGD